MEEREEREEEEEEEEREERNRFIPSFFLPLLFLAVLVSLFLSDATTTTASRNFLSATGHVNYVGRRDENLGNQGSTNNDERNRQFDENENRDSSIHDLFGGNYFFGGKPT